MLPTPTALQRRATLCARAMRILDRYIIREVSRHALLGLAVFTFVFFVPQLVRLMELFVRHTGSGSQILTLFLCLIPSVFTFTIPMAVLIGVLLGLGRMSADSEIIALTALGIGRRRILLPVGALALVGAGITLLMTLWFGPLALRTFRTIEADLITSQISFQVQPRVFDERFPKFVLYINNVSASGTHWNGVFIAEAGAEVGLRGYESYTWFGLFGPKGLDAQIVARLNAAVKEALETPSVRERLIQLGNTPRWEAPEQFRATVKSDRAKWAAVVKASGATID